MIGNIYTILFYKSKRCYCLRLVYSSKARRFIRLSLNSEKKDVGKVHILRKMENIKKNSQTKNIQQTIRIPSPKLKIEN